MKRVLITAFGPYDSWTENASWLALKELTRDLPDGLAITTRRYPVDFAEVKERLQSDLAGGYDIALHLGQAPGTSQIHLEAVGLNVGCRGHQLAEDAFPLAPDGPLAYRSDLPLAQWAKMLRAAGIPAQVSFHAGTYLCNATLYWTHYLSQTHGWPTAAVFIHFPVDISQIIDQPRDTPHLPAALSAAAVRLILTEILGH